MQIFGKTLIVLVDAQEFRRVAFTNFFSSLLSGKNVLLLDCKSVDSVNFAQILPGALETIAPLFILHAGALRLGDSRIARDIAVLRLLVPKCLVLVMVDDDWNGDIGVAVSLAINGVVGLSMPPRDVIAAIEIALSGGTYFPTVNILGKAARESAVPISDDFGGYERLEPAQHGVLTSDSPALPRIPMQEKAPANSRMGSTDSDRMNLSRRQTEVLKTLQSGLSNKEIARSLGLSEATIKIHVRHLMRKFGAANRTQVAVLSRQGDMGGMGGITANPGFMDMPSL